jgi:lysozyme family protein
MRYSAFWSVAKVWWDKMEITGNKRVSRARAVALFTSYAEYAIEHKQQYEVAESATGVPWWMIAVIHRREGDADFGTYLGNGQSLRRRTTVDPIGRGPFLGPHAFIDGCVDACRIDGLTTTSDWRLEKQLYYEQKFNGFGYHGPSPYVWGLTNIQVPGKYVRDHVFDPNYWDTQPGCAPLTWMIAKLDSTVKLVREEA